MNNANLSLAVATTLVLAFLVLHLCSHAVHAAPIDCSKNPIYCAIKKLQPATKNKLALDLSNYIHKWSQEYGTDPLLSVAIAMQESSIRNVHRKNTILVITEVCSSTESKEKECIEYVSAQTGYTDVGLWQFYAATITDYGMDALRLRDDLDYATKMHCWLLAKKIKLCSDLKDKAWTCYHSRTPKYRRKYYNRVIKFYEKIN